MKTKLSLTASVLAIGIGLAVTPASAWKQAYPQPVGKYPSIANLDPQLTKWWANWKTQFLNGGLVSATDPDGKPSYVSEAQSYGMLLSVWMNDQAAFNSCYNVAQNQFWNSTHYGWLRKSDPNYGGRGGGNFAGDADQDIAGALIFASMLVEKGHWSASLEPALKYKTQASTILKNAPGLLINGNGNVYSWNNKDDALNPSYHMPHWYPVFKDFAAKNSITTANWDKVRDASYAMFNGQHSPPNGFARNWSTASGAGASAGTASKPTEQDMGFDGIRVPWRIGLDAIWYRYSKAMALIKATWTAGMVNTAKPGMYKESALWGWCESTNGCTPEYERQMTRAMWLANAVGAKDTIPAAATAASDMYFGGFAADNNLTYTYIGDYDVGTAAAGTNTSDKNYFTQSLGLFGTLAMTGNAPNIWDDLNYTWVPVDTATKSTAPVKVTPDSMYSTTKGDTSKIRITAAFSKAVLWTAYLKGRTSGSNKFITVKTASAKLDTTLFLTLATAGETADLKVFWPTCKSTDTLRTTVRIVAKSGVGILERPAYQIPGIQRLDGSVLKIASVLPEEEIQMVRFLDARGRVIASTNASRTVDGLRLDQVPQLRGITFFDIVMRSARHQGRLFGL